MVGLLNFQISRALFLALAIVLVASAACWAGTPGSIGSHPMSALIAVPAAIVGLLLLIGLCAKFVHNDPHIEAQMRAEAGDRSVTPVPGHDGHIHFH